MTNICKRQFRKRCFGFHCNSREEDDFYTTQWSNSRAVYLIYRTIMWIYVFGWWMAYYIERGIHNPSALRISYRFLTIWGRWYITVYFSLALVLSAIGYARRYSVSPEPRVLKWTRSATWMFHSVAQNIALLITIVYWAALSPLAPPGSLGNPFNIDLHAINSVLVLIEIFVVRSPMRLLHSIYPFAFGVAYLVATLIYHGVGDTSAVYPILNWGSSPGVAAGLGIGICLIGVPLVHSFFFGLFCLRLTIVEKCKCGKSYDRKMQHDEVGADNPVFTIEPSTNQTN